MSNITLQQLEAFIAVAHSQSISKAADQLFISQPSLSKTLHRFEESIGFEVFSRRSNGVTLNAAGEFLFQSVSDVYQRLEDAIKGAHDISRMHENELHILLVSSFDCTDSYELIVRLLREFESTNPEICLEEKLYDFKELQIHYDNNEADIVIAPDFVMAGLHDIEIHGLSTYPIFLAMSCNHPLAKYDSPPVDLLAEETIYHLTGAMNSSAQAGIFNACKKMGFVPKKIVAVDNFQTHIHNLRRNRGISFCGHFRTISDIKYYPLEGILEDSRYCVAWRKSYQTQATKLFIRYISKHLIK